MNTHTETSRQIHFLSILILGISSSVWAVAAKHYLMPLIWLGLLSILVITHDPGEFRHFIKRFTQLGSALIIVSFIHILFRREGAILFRWNDIPLIYSDGAREAILVWIRFMILFVLAKIFTQVSLFHFLVFLNKLGLSLQMSLLFQTTLKLIPFIFYEARKALWFLRFRGIDLRSLSIKHKFSAIRKLLYPLLIRGIHYASYSALALETRGFGVVQKVKIDQKYPLRFIDYSIISITLLLNFWGLNNIF